MNTHTQIDFNNWFVLSTMPGSECKLRRLINTLTQRQVELYLPHREIYHRLKGNFKTVTRPLFPGYIFVYKDIETLLMKCRHSFLEGQLHPVCFNKSFLKVKASEMASIIKLAGMDGVVKTSRGIVYKDKTVIITDGPLKNYTGRLVFINKRKRKVKVMVDVLNRKFAVTLGLDIVKSK